MNKKTILFVSNTYFPHYSGGVVQSIVATRDMLQEQGWRVPLVTLDFSGTQKRFCETQQIYYLHCAIRFMYKQNYMAVPFFAQHYLATIIKKEQPLIIHVHHPFLLGVAALKCAIKYNIPIVFTYHSMYEHYLYYIPLSLIRRCVGLLLPVHIRQFCNRVNAIIAPSNSVQHYLFSRKISKNIITLPSPIRNIFRKIAPLSPKNESEPFLLLTVSRFRKEKNISFLLNVFASFKCFPFELNLIGYGSDFIALKDEAYNILKISPNKIKFFIKPEENILIEMYKKAAVFIFASQLETQGLVFAEAMACGTPVIALDGPGARDIIIDGNNGFLVHSQDEMKERILHIYINKNVRMQLQRGAQRTAKEYFSDAISKKLINCYQRLV